MTTRLIGGAAAVFITLLMTPTFGQTAPSGASAVAQAAQAQAPSDNARPARRARKKADKKSGKEPSAGQMAARERQKKCAAEWKTAKEAGKVEAGMKWPKFWSQCNTRLKAEKA
jgi:hypothetical protein